ncbi:MAG TPA: hypothetical protein VMX18_01575 [Candidatus Bipolaricaulota bacterium]|nr:hypothetical protein [Candidatus Bipolaricaulota bacterium]
MGWNPFKGVEQGGGSATDAVLEDLNSEDERERNFAVGEIVRLFNQDATMFDGSEDKVINALRGVNALGVKEVLQGMQELKGAKVDEDNDKVREMPALKISEGLDELLKAKKDFEKMNEDPDELIGFMGALRQMVGKNAYMDDPEFVNRVISSIELVADAVSVWPNKAEKADLEESLVRWERKLPLEIKSQMMKKVA